MKIHFNKNAKDILPDLRNMLDPVIDYYQYLSRWKTIRSTIVYGLTFGTIWSIYVDYCETINKPYWSDEEHAPVLSWIEHIIKEIEDSPLSNE